MLRKMLGLAALLALTTFATAQLPTRARITTRTATGLSPVDLARLQAQGAVPGVTTLVTPAAGADAPAAPSQLIQQLKKLKFDRRPSAFLAAWAKPEPKPFDEDPDFDEARKEIADLEAEIAATPVPTPPSATPEDAAKVEDAAKTEDAAKAEDATKAGDDAKPTESAQPF